MYCGTVLFFLGTPLLLGSWWGLLMAPLFVVLFAIRTGIEERALVAGLPGYADYAAGCAIGWCREFGRMDTTRSDGRRPRCPIAKPTPAAATAAWCGSNAPPILRW